jgi:hypothetical protein
MAYDRDDSRETPRDERSRWRDERYEGRDRGYSGYSGREDRGFFDRAGDEIASWFGDEEAERRRREDQRMIERERGYGGGPDWRRDEERGRFLGRDWGRGRSSDEDRARFLGQGREPDRGRYERDEDRFRSAGWTGRDYSARERGYGREADRGYRPMTGDYGRSEEFFAASGYGRGERGLGDYERAQSPYGRDEYRRTSFAGSSRDYDPHYRSWRERQLSELDRDYDDYRRENQSRFEDDFGNWRQRRQQKRGLLGTIREHMEVVGSDDQHVGTVDHVVTDRIILTKSDPESGGVHHSLSCSDIDRVEGDRVILDCTAEQAKQLWRDESRSRALFEREDQGEMGPRVLGRSFEGTYR